MSIAPQANDNRPGRNIPALLVSIAITFCVATVGETITIPAVHGWYLLLDKPFFTPPDWVFAPVWTALYVMMAVAAWLVWLRRNEDPAGVRDALGLYALQLSLNLLWSMLFFGLHTILLAMIEILCLLLATALTVATFRRYSALAAWLMSMNFLWVAFAAVLTAGFWYLN